MGEQFLAEKAKWFANRQDRLHKRHFESADLLTATADRRETVYRFKSKATDLMIGDPVLFVDDGHPSISVFQGMRRIGAIDSAGTADLRRLFGEFPALSNSIGANICDAKDWAGYYSAVIVH